MPIKPKDKISSEFEAVSVTVASPENMMEWSHGEVKKPETINYRTQKPEMDGLFCERIFGPTKNWECYCGKYKKIRYKNIVCDKCGVEVTRSNVRRERMGHIKLAVPVAHIWYLRSTPSRLGLLLDISVKDLERVVYFANYIVKEVHIEARDKYLNELDGEYKQYKKQIKDELDKEKNELQLKKKQGEKVTDKDLQNLETQAEKKHDELTEQFEQTREHLGKLEPYQTLSELNYRDYSMKFGHCFTAGIGAEAIKEVIANLDLEKLITYLKGELRMSVGQKRKKIIRRIMLAASMLRSNIKPEWMVMTIVPVIPPDLRPMVQLDGGRFATSDLNDLYRRVINRNNRLGKLINMQAPEVICRNEKRMLQEAVDALLHNSFRQGKTVTKTGSRNISLKSLSDILKGKQGRFRQNLLGKRVDYSGRSVIVVGPNLQLHECGIPKKMALELFKPFVIGELITNGIAHNIKNAEKLMTWNKPEIWDALEKVTKDHYVLLNRAPTLHRLGIQGFRPVLVEGKAIQLHPLVCAAFNADFDGDQMAVHVPLSKMAQWETKNIIASNKNILKPSSGFPIINPSLDMVLGCYYLTGLDDRKPLFENTFANRKEAYLANEMKHIHLRQRINIRLDGEIIETTVGRVIFNDILPPEVDYINDTFDSKALSKLISMIYDKTSKEITAQTTDKIKELGFKYSTVSGISLAATDMTVPEQKGDLLAESDVKVEEINKLYRHGLITDNERYNHVIKVWEKCKNSIQSLMMDKLDPYGPIYQMLTSGARGNVGQLTQMAGMKGLVTNPAGRIIELPVKANFKEGAKMIEYFIAQHGGRKGRSDTALKTASAGYLTRRLVDAVQDVLITDEDCGTTKGVILNRAETHRVGTEYAARIFGRTLTADVKVTKDIIYKKDHLLGREEVAIIMEHGTDDLPVRSVITCKTQSGICRKCYGRDMASNDLVKSGSSVGVIAAQSIGEPGTQLTMRTFHMGGVAEGKDITQGLPRVEELFEARIPKFEADIAEINGKVSLENTNTHTMIHIQSDEREQDAYKLIEGFEPCVKVGDEVGAKSVIGRKKNAKGTLKTKAGGVVESIDGQEIIIRHLENAEKTYKVSLQDSLLVKNGDIVTKGTPLIEGHLDLKKLSEVTTSVDAQKYIVKEVQSIYASQGQIINDKHIEIIARQMFSKCRILEPGGSPYLPGQLVDILEAEETQEVLYKDKKRPMVYERLLLGLTRLSLSTDSWLSAASFQETIRVLVEASTTRKVDGLNGLKENVIIGKLIPAGTNYPGFIDSSVIEEVEREEIEVAES